MKKKKKERKEEEEKEGRNGEPEGGRGSKAGSVKGTRRSSKRDGTVSYAVPYGTLLVPSR
jgi:hypothetical protein